MDNGDLQFINGNLSSTLTNAVFLSTLNKLKATFTNNNTKVAFAPKTGLVKGTFTHPNNSSLPTKFESVMIRTTAEAHGSFLGTTQTGEVYLYDLP